ncbi:MAG: ATP-binding cassette domain-containing protein [Gammaproteobacteria bacterium]|nr:ATP-binding cassette domain-containing protein [Gammaproteobacteria bacterium]MDE0247658.1 ATP-binding cassette domain-containing protein [Gammaproteobacteria bacterium]MDE0394728.1 ATP-binding cassette domain-containing protein [Gammaproteobacteria bacterium]
MIEYRNVWKAYDAPVLTGVDLGVEEGEMFGVFGPSGTGKSVLLKTTIGLIPLDRGDVRVAGESAYRSGERVIQRIRERVGYVFQHAALFDSMTVYENVEMGIPEQELKRLSRSETARKIWGALDLVNLEPPEVTAKLPAELSGGMKKRVGIARAIVARPRILLWDEPTTGLDPVNTVAVQKLIVQLSGELNVTSVIVTHDVEGGLEMCDRVAMLEGGILRFVGAPAAFRRSADPVVRAFIDRAAAEAALAVVGEA